MSIAKAPGFGQVGWSSAWTGHLSSSNVWLVWVGPASLNCDSINLLGRR